MRTRKKGFTLIELLVVIAIIALLLSILMPSLKKVKKAAQDVICRSNLRQWGQIIAIYLDDNDGGFSDQFRKEYWTVAFEPYYQDPKILLCAAAKQLANPHMDPGNNGRGSNAKSWGKLTEDLYMEKQGILCHRRGQYGSYGKNGWVSRYFGNDPDLKERYWGKINAVKTPSKVAIFADCSWKGLWPEAEDRPADNGDSQGGGGGLNRCCIDRHNGAINAVMADLSVEKIYLKRLWSDVIWHKKWKEDRLADGPFEWPEWMENMKE